jgi:capsular polysaccharide biosynthesis protein
MALVHTSTRGHGVLEIPGAVVSGKRGQVGLNSTELLLEASPLAPGDTRALFADSTAALAIGLEELDGVTMSIWAGQNNYAHCLLQSVPRLHLLQQGFGLEADRYLLRDDAPRPAIDAVTILGIPADRVQLVPFRDAPAYRCEMLRGATAPFLAEFGIPWVATFLNDLFLPDPPPTESRRLYVRRGIANRLVLNEDDVLALLEPAGFEAVTMDGHSVAEQATMFASAEVVVASHGAALANLVFARPGTTVVELMGTNYVSQLYAYLAWRRGLSYSVIMGTEPAPPARWWTWQFRADTVVDVRALRSRLERLDLL